MISPDLWKDIEIILDKNFSELLHNLKYDDTEALLPLSFINMREEIYLVLKKYLD